MPSAPLSASSQPRVSKKTSTPRSKSRGYIDKENKPNDSNKSRRDAEVDHSKEGPSEQEGPTFPSTPAVRIALEDLIGNTEDIFNRPAPLGTPGDHVHWHNGPNSSDVGSAAHTTQRSRKRARSSSPASSQLERSAHFGTQGDAAARNQPTETLHTPDHDPTQDLWRRYMNANGSRHVETETLPALARLPPSSPTTPSTGTKDSGLRRTVSCGIEWPTSKSKRRKLDVVEAHNRTKNIFAASRREILAREVSKTSRVTLLVEKIQESLARQARAADEPSSSSPLPGRHSQLPLSQGSPIRSPSKQRNTREQSEPHSSAPVGPTAIIEAHEPMLDDFEDDGLDLEFFEQVEKGMSQVAVSQKPAVVVRDFAASQSVRPDVSVKKPEEARLSQTKPTTSARPVVEVTKPELDIEFDAFDAFDAFDDDDDDDMFTTEMESLVAQVDSQDRHNVSRANKVSEAIIPELPAIPEFDGSFDNGDDDDLLLQIADDVDHGKTGVGPVSQVRPPR